MHYASRMQRIPCPSCGGAGGGPFGRAGGAWDTEDYVCPRCEGAGTIEADGARPSTRPGIAKAQTPQAAPGAAHAAKNGRATGS
jgi:hypothetical protein